MPAIDLDCLRSAVQDDRYIMSTHAKQRMGFRRVTDAAMKVVIGEPLYVVCAFDGRYAYIITVHWYDPETWENPWTRKRK